VHDADLTTMFADRAQLAVARTVPLPFTAAVARFVSSTTPDGLQVDRLWKRDATGPFGRGHLAPARAAGALRAGRRVVPVELELAPWSDTMTQLVLRPSAPRAYRWGARRRRHWYPAAHAAADALRHDVLTASSRVAAANASQERDRRAG
jgi:hypothetical protein